MAIDRMPDSHFMASSNGGACYQNTHGTPITMGVPNLGCLVASIGMALSSSLMPERGLATANYNFVANFPEDAAMVPQQQQLQAASSNSNSGLIKGGWTREEDEVLRQMVRHHGDRKWAEIAKSLPGRIGKQCRERWTNHLHPDIKKGIWTEEEDRKLIKAHQTYGNRWSAIARSLPGRSENTVKNHWNATKRSLNSKRRLRKKNSEQAVPGQPSLLEEYIRSCQHATPHPPQPDLNLLNITPVVPHLNTSGYCLQFDARGNLQYGQLPVQPHGISAQAGPSNVGTSGSTGGMDNNGVIQMASNQFVMPSEDGGILDMARWIS
uniref:Uncharacterized protein n=1 Tax=Oryza meridionalis TaxID=40149 RepID=A0A0E0E9J6_9ORYZ